MSKSLSVRFSACNLGKITTALTHWTLEIRPHNFEHGAQIHSQLVQGRATEIPVPAIKVMDRKIGQQRKGVGHGSDTAALRCFGHVEQLDHLAFLIAQERKTRPQPGTKRVVHFRRIHAHDRELAIVNRELLLKFNIMAQLHLTLSSPVAPIKRQDERKFSDESRKLHRLPVLVRQFYIWKVLAN